MKKIILALLVLGLLTALAACTDEKGPETNTKKVPTTDGVTTIDPDWWQGATGESTTGGSEENTTAEGNTPDTGEDSGDSWSKNY